MTKYQHATVDGAKIFYREASRNTALTIFLLHGFPTSSDMFRNLISVLSDPFGCGLRELTEAEAAFPVLKRELSTRPLFHQKEPRVKAHVLVAFSVTPCG